MDLFPKRGIRCNTVAPGPVWCAQGIQKNPVGFVQLWVAALEASPGGPLSYLGVMQATAKQEGAADCREWLLAFHALGWECKFLC